MSAVTYKFLIEKLLNLTINRDFGEDIFKNIYESLKWDDYYYYYDEINGFFSKANHSVNIQEKHLYLPYMIYYLENRCARVFFIYCGNNIIENKLIAVTIYEGSFGDIDSITGYITEKLFNYNELHQMYLFGKELTGLPSDHWKHNFYIKSNCEKALNLVKHYANLLNIHSKHFEDMDQLCLIIANVHINFAYNTDGMINSKFYCYEFLKDEDENYYFCVNLEDENILCKEYTSNKNGTRMTNCSYNKYNLDYPLKMNNFFV